MELELRILEVRTKKSCSYCAFDIFQKVIFSSALYTEEDRRSKFANFCHDLMPVKPFVVTTHVQSVLL